MLVSRSRLTYRVDRLVELGYVDREECEDDRRGLFAILTDDGVAAFQRASEGHLTDVRSLFFDLVDLDELGLLHQVMARVDANLSSTS